MNTSESISYKPLMRSFSKWMMFFSAVLFCVAGRIIHDIWDIQRQLAYMQGMGFAFMCGGIGSILNTLVDSR